MGIPWAVPGLHHLQGLLIVEGLEQVEFDVVAGSQCNVMCICAYVHMCICA